MPDTGTAASAIEDLCATGGGVKSGQGSAVRETAQSPVWSLGGGIEAKAESPETEGVAWKR